MLKAPGLFIINFFFFPQLGLKHKFGLFLAYFWLISRKIEPFFFLSLFVLFLACLILFDQKTKPLQPATVVSI